MANNLSRCAGRLLVSGFAGPTLAYAARNALAQGAIGGLILFKRNVESVTSVVELVQHACAAAAGVNDLVIGVDQEGGRVARFGSPVLKLPPMRALGDSNDIELAYRSAKALATQLRSLGMTLCFAPVLDVDTNPENPVIGDRAFSRDPERVAEYGGRWAVGLKDGGVLGCGKHFPGHGDTALDSHLALPRVSRSRDELRSCELVPFMRNLEHLPSIMTAHVVYNAYDTNHPATLSRAIIFGVLRTELRYEGVVVSDDLEMKAVSERYTIAEAACMAVDAGCDMLLCCGADIERALMAHEALTKEAEGSQAFRGRLREAAERVAAMAASCRPTPQSDAAARQAAFEGPALERVIQEIGCLTTSA